MTILCITTTGLPGIRPCTHRGQHRVMCLDQVGLRASDASDLDRHDSHVGDPG